MAKEPRHALPAEALSARELLVLLDMCVDAEERCERRYQAAVESGDQKAAADAARLRETYGDLKHRLFRAMKEPGTSTDDMRQTLAQLRAELATRFPEDPAKLPRSDA